MSRVMFRNEIFGKIFSNPPNLSISKNVRDNWLDIRSLIVIIRELPTSDGKRLKNRHRKETVSGPRQMFYSVFQ